MDVLCLIFMNDYNMSQDKLRYKTIDENFIFLLIVCLGFGELIGI